MDPTHSPRIAFSFAPGIFDIERMNPLLWSYDDECGSAFVQLDGCWSRLLPALGKTGLLMACAPSSPVTAAVALNGARFESVPDSTDWVCLETGVEICSAKLGGVLATMEPLKGAQQSAALQFFDLNGEGCLKLLVTNRSDITAFEHLVSRHAMPQHIPPLVQLVLMLRWYWEQSQTPRPCAVSGGDCAARCRRAPSLVWKVSRGSVR